MQNIIAINKTVLDGAEVNSVNARELHEALEVKTKFADWVNRAIEKYDFERDKDYTILRIENSTKGLQATIDFVITLDMAKELAMLENNPKGKETRKYFIEAEKQARQPLTASEQIVLLAKGHGEIDERLTRLENDVPVNNQQQHALMSAKNDKVYSMINNHPAEFSEADARKLHRKVWQLFKKRFSLPRYNELPNGQFSDGIYFINNITFGDML